jgi:hypothetical protein
MATTGSIESALLKIPAAAAKRPHGLVGELDELAQTIRRYPWTALTSMQGNEDVLKKIDETEKLLKDLRKALK